MIFFLSTRYCLHHLDGNEKLLKVFAYPSNNRVFYGRELNLQKSVFFFITQLRMELYFEI